MLKRIIYGLLAGTAVIGTIIYLPKFIVNITVTLVAIGAIYEFIEAANKMGYKPIKTVSYLSCAIIPCIGFDSFQIYKWIGIFAGILVIWALIYASFIRDKKMNLVDICFTFFGIIYVTFLFSYLIEVYYMKYAQRDIGKFLIWFVLFGACGTDIFAYFIGSKFGKHKLCPNISPKKTVEGAIAGVFGCVVIFLIYTYFLNTYGGFRINYISISVMAIIISVFSQLGDLVASSIKRSADIKDFGNFLPGHGGILDRIDSLLFAAPVTYYLFIIIMDFVSLI